MSTHYEVPKWAGKPPVGLHLDVLKEDKLIQKLMVDEKKCYLFGRNQQLNDFCIDHASCSRVHAALVYHKHLNRNFLVDLGSVHGTFIGNMRLEGNKPTQLPIDSTFHFGASTRNYIIRERPNTGANAIIDELEKNSEENDSASLLPETETELENLTEYNTARNKRISMLGITEDEIHKPKRNKRKGITFNDEEEIINPEDVDPSVGRFRNLVKSAVVQSKKMKIEGSLITSQEETRTDSKHMQSTSMAPQLYHELPLEHPSSSDLFPVPSTSLTSSLGIRLPNPAPEVDMEQNQVSDVIDDHNPPEEQSIEPKKKKYMKEAWPGRKSFSHIN